MIPRFEWAARGKQQVSDFVSDGSAEQRSQMARIETRDEFDPRKEDVQRAICVPRGRTQHLGVEPAALSRNRLGQRGAEHQDRDVGKPVIFSPRVLGSVFFHTACTPASA